MRKHKIMLTIRALEIGGAERQFIELIRNLDLTKYELCVLTNYKGTLDTDIDNYFHVIMQKKGFWDFGYFLRLIFFLYKFRPDLVYSFMPDMNITMSIAKLFCIFRYKLIWGQFGSEPDFNDYASVMKKLFQIQKRIEFTVNGVLSDGTQGLTFYRKMGYKLKVSEVIYSGTDINRFKRNEIDRNNFRLKYGLSNEMIAIGICSRLDPMKGYDIFAEAAKSILNKYNNVIFFSIGYGNEAIKKRCNEILDEYAQRFIWLGKITNPEKYLSGWDIYCSASLYGEGFSNSIIEAMSCSLPVIATKVGEADFQVGDKNLIIEPGNASHLVDKIINIIENKSHADLGKLSRKRIEENFSSVVMASKTQMFFNKVLQLN